MAIFVGSDEHRDFVSSVVDSFDRIHGSYSKVFYYKNVRFKGFSAGGLNIGEQKVVFPQELIDELDNDDYIILIVRGKYGTWNSDAIFMESCLLIDTLKSGGPNMKGKKAKRLCVVMPKEGYVKQDHIFLGEDEKIMYGEPISIATERKVLKSLGADMLLTIYPHDFRLSEDKEGWIKTGSPKNNITKSLTDMDGHETHTLQDWTGFAWAINPVKLIPKFIKENKIKIDVVASPDEGAYKFSGYIAEEIGSDCVYIDSHRSRDDGAKVTNRNALNYSMEGKVVLIPDDWILTGSKIKNAIKWLRANEARRGLPKEIHIAVIHGELTGETYEDLIKMGAKIYCSNSIENPAQSIDIAPLISERIKELFIRK